jgi:UDPglucose 6-dehydrogenase
LTERSARLDVLTQNSAILGGSKINTGRVRKLYESRFYGLQIIETDSTTAEFIKYLSNVFFASKVSFMNEMKLVANKVGVDWETAVHGLVSNGRVANTHLQVPGPDGKLGFGGTCFAKDICSFISFAEGLGVDLNVIKGAWKTNIAVREERDWEGQKGRAVE